MAQVRNAEIFNTRRGMSKVSLAKNDSGTYQTESATTQEQLKSVSVERDNSENWGDSDDDEQTYGADVLDLESLLDSQISETAENPHVEVIFCKDDETTEALPSDAVDMCAAIPTSATKSPEPELCALELPTMSCPTRHPIATGIRAISPPNSPSPLRSQSSPALYATSYLPKTSTARGARKYRVDSGIQHDIVSQASDQICEIDNTQQCGQKSTEQAKYHDHTDNDSLDDFLENL